MIFSILLPIGATAAITLQQGYYSDNACQSALTSDSPICSGLEASACSAFNAQASVKSCSVSNCAVTVTFDESSRAACSALEDASTGCTDAVSMSFKQEFNCGSDAPEEPNSEPETEPEQDDKPTEGGDDKTDIDDGKTDDGKTDDGKTDNTKTKDADDGEKDGAAALSMIVALVTPFLAML